ncbi:MAG: hypothetical protein EHM47_12695 [Ignavibacteriales bacterium]|nr:MAG: hypothetical protein EHM47_12695 [Ignavibacteriales bacterium]
MKNKIVNHCYEKESWKDKNGEVPIYLRITVNGERSEISTNRKVDPELWDKASQRVTGRYITYLLEPPSHHTLIHSLTVMSALFFS